MNIGGTKARRREGTEGAVRFRMQFIALFLALLLVAPVARAAKDVDFDQAESLRNRRKPEEAIVLYQKVIARPNVELDDKARSQWGIVECLRQLKKYEDALAQARQLHDSLGADHWIKRQAAGGMCDLLSLLDRFDEAAAVAASTAQAAADEREVAADWRLRCAGLYMRGKKYPEAYEQAGRAVALAKEAEDSRRILDALWAQSDAMFTAKEYEKCMVPLQLALELKLPEASPGSWLRFKQRIAECYTKLDRVADVRAAYKSFTQTEADPVQRQRWWLAIARTWETEKNPAEAIAAYEQVIIDHPESCSRDYWYEAQTAILRLTLAAQPRDDAAALRLMRLCFDVADTRERIGSLAMQILGQLPKVDGDTMRARAFATYQQFGPNGPDDNPGTSDDLLNPLERAGYPANPARVAAFEAASAKLGCDAQAALHRGWMCAYLGRPREAVTWFGDAARRSAGSEYQAAVHALVFVGGRGATGSISDAERFADYVLHGPGGADGKQKLADPFAAVAAARALPGSTLTDPQRATLKEVALRLSTGLDRGLWQPEMKIDVIAALERVHGGLGDWDTPGLADWYLARLKSEPASSKTQESMVDGALAAARAGQFHLAGLRRFLARLEGPEGARPIVRETVRKAWTNWISKIEKESRAKTLVPRMKVL